MKRICWCGVAVAAFGWVVSDVQAWWAEGHEQTTTGAVEHLPQPLKAYLRANVTQLATLAGHEPAGAHYIDIDYYPEFFAGTLPHDKDVLIAMYGSTVVNQNGTAPWTVGDYVASLSSAMASAHTADAWLALLTTAGELAHYVEDLHNPLHLTENYNGQLTGNTGIHSRYEGEMISRHLADLTITPSAGSCVYVASPVDTVFDGIDADYQYVQPILDADVQARGRPPTYREAYYTAMWNLTGGFTHTLYQQASELTASMWYTAWVNAGSPTPIFAADFDADGDVDLGDFAHFQACFNGPNRPAPTAGCGNADLDGDEDVDLGDFTILQACFNGPNRPPACS